MTTSSREALLNLLCSVEPTDEKERKDLAFMLEQAQSMEEPCLRSQANGHFTASAIIVDPKGERVCLVKHLKLGKWLQPGGHIEPEDLDQPLQAAIREAKEETNLDVRLVSSIRQLIDIDVHLFPARQDQPEHWHLDLRFLFVADRPEELQVNEAEAGGAEWVTWEEAIHRAAWEPAFVRCLEKARLMGA